VSIPPEHRLARGGPAPAARCDNALLDTLRVGSKARWIRVPATEREKILYELPTGGTSAFAFAVRAVDIAGAVEPSLEQNRNYIQFSVSSEPSKPTVIIGEDSVGRVRMPGSSSVVQMVWDVDVPAGRPLRFQWEGDATSYRFPPGQCKLRARYPGSGR